MEEDAWRRLAIAHCTGESATGQRRSLLGAEGPTEQAPGMPIHHRGEIAPLVLDFQIRDIAHPDLIWALHVDFMGCALDAAEEPPEAREPAVLAGRTGANAVLSHQSFDAPFADSFALVSQCGMDSRAAVGGSASPMDGLNLLQQTGVLMGTLTDRALSPSVITRRTDPIETAHRSHRERFLAVLDEGKDVPFRAEVNAMAFFKRSCSSLRRS